MINTKKFYDLLKKHEIIFFTGVPDSLLKDFCAYITDFTPKNNHIISANEGGSIALASGYNLATDKIPLVYMQNSGLGNTINPLLSLADENVYSIPILLLIGWRGSPDIKDEPQHVKQGAITTDLLDTMKIPYSILPQNIDSAKVCLKHAIDNMKSFSRPFALVIRKDTFKPYKLKKQILK